MDPMGNWGILVRCTEKLNDKARANKSNTSPTYYLASGYVKIAMEAMTQL